MKIEHEKIDKVESYKYLGETVKMEDNTSAKTRRNFFI